MGSFDSQPLTVARALLAIGPFPFLSRRLPGKIHCGVPQRLICEDTATSALKSPCVPAEQQVQLCARCSIAVLLLSQVYSLVVMVL